MYTPIILSILTFPPNTRARLSSACDLFPCPWCPPHSGLLPEVAPRLLPCSHSSVGWTLDPWC